jgi:hypothetical protein
MLDVSPELERSLDLDISSSLTSANNKSNADTPIHFLNGKTLSLFDLAADPVS